MIPYDCDVVVILTRTSDGKTATIRQPSWLYINNGFCWTDGNHGCDCNRATLFAAAVGEEEPLDTPCGYHRFKLISLNVEIRMPQP